MNFDISPILFKVHQLNQGQRSIYSSYHVLKGNKTMQTIQDLHLFNLKPFFGLLPFITRSEVEESIKKNSEKNIIQTDEHNVISLTDKGALMVEEYWNDHPYFASLNGYSYSQMDIIFWNRCLLLIQSLTSIKNQKKFNPIIQDWKIQAFIKVYLMNQNQSVDSLLHAIYEEIHSFLVRCEPIQASIFVALLTSSNSVGLTLNQVAEREDLTKIEATLIHKATIHQLISELLIHDQNTISILNRLLKDLQKKSELTVSTQKTKSLLENGLSIKDISKKRQLKSATILDHIVELALVDPHFSLKKFMTLEEYLMIQKAIKQSKSHKLKDIKEALPVAVDYFLIRLVLARKDFTNGFI
ncbi:hypothetical protein BTS2_2237 [Bacillus sp. TS-2]|nr:hypothetical protein BTS2_2237 [Bacillus sp. TS-2]